MSRQRAAGNQSSLEKYLQLFFFSLFFFCQRAEQILCERVVWAAGWSGVGGRRACVALKKKQERGKILNFSRIKSQVERRSGSKLLLKQTKNKANKAGQQ